MATVDRNSSDAPKKRQSSVERQSSVSRTLSALPDSTASPADENYLLQPIEHVFPSLDPTVDDGGLRIEWVEGNSDRPPGVANVPPKEFSETPETPTFSDGHVERSPDGSIWFDGEVLACTCPDCGSMMSIRLWLMLADCWICGSGVELTERQQRMAEQLIAQREARRGASGDRPKVDRQAPTTPRTSRPSESSPKAPPVQQTETGASAAAATTVIAPSAPAQESTDPDFSTLPRRQVASSTSYRNARERVRKAYQRGGLLAILLGFLNDLPAWIISTVVHAVILLLLSMIVTTVTEDEERITLSTTIAYDDLEGDTELETEPIDEMAFEFEDPGMEMTDQEEFVQEELATILQPDLDIPPPEFEPVEDTVSRFVPEAVRHSPPMQLELPETREITNMYAGRRPELRSRLATETGGTTETEAAVSRALVFLSRHQSPDGRWSMKNFHKTPDCDSTCRDGGSKNSDIAATALSLLPFLGAGQSHKEGKYQTEVLRGLEWLISQQGEDGNLWDRDGRMYAHGMAAIVLCEAYALTGDPNLQEPASRAISFIVASQYNDGGWRYETKNLNQQGDLSVVGWQLMALQSARHVGNMHVPNRTLDAASLFLDRVKKDDMGSRYAYTRGQGDKPAMTAEGLLCRLYLGWPTTHPGIRKGVLHLLRDHPPDAAKPNIYYWYYATQVMHHVGGDAWRKWNAQMKRTLLDMQTRQGHSAGSWKPEGEWAKEGGRLFMTAMATCMLEVYYRHMPLNTNEILGIVDPSAEEDASSGSSSGGPGTMRIGPPTDSRSGTMHIGPATGPHGTSRPATTPRPVVPKPPTRNTPNPNDPPDRPEGNLNDLF